MALVALPFSKKASAQIIFIIFNANFDKLISF
jgi:hypothetical protein